MESWKEIINKEFAVGQHSTHCHSLTVTHSLSHSLCLLCAAVRSFVRSAFDVRRSMFGVRCSVFDVRCLVFGVRCSVFGVRYSAFGIRRSAFGRCGIVMAWYCVLVRVLLVGGCCVCVLWRHVCMSWFPSIRRFRCSCARSCARGFERCGAVDAVDAYLHECLFSFTQRPRIRSPLHVHFSHCVTLLGVGLASAICVVLLFCAWVSVCVFVPLVRFVLPSRFASASGPVLDLSVVVVVLFLCSCWIRSLGFVC